MKKSDFESKFFQAWRAIIDKCFEDADYKKSVLKDPRQAFEKEGLTIPGGKNLLITEESGVLGEGEKIEEKFLSQDTLKLILPKEKPHLEELSDKELLQISGAGDWVIERAYKATSEKGDANLISKSNFIEGQRVGKWK